MSLYGEKCEKLKNKMIKNSIQALIRFIRACMKIFDHLMFYFELCTFFSIETLIKAYVLYERSLIPYKLL